MKDDKERSDLRSDKNKIKCRTSSSLDKPDVSEYKWMQSWPSVTLHLQLNAITNIEIGSERVGPLIRKTLNMDCGLRFIPTASCDIRRILFTCRQETGTISGPWVQLFEAECFSSEPTLKCMVFDLQRSKNVLYTATNASSDAFSAEHVIGANGSKAPLQACKWDFTTGTYIQKNKQKITGLKSFRVTDWCAKYFYVMLGRAKHQKKLFIKIVLIEKLPKAWILPELHFMLCFFSRIWLAAKRTWFPC